MRKEGAGVNKERWLVGGLKRQGQGVEKKGFQGVGKKKLGKGGKKGSCGLRAKKSGRLQKKWLGG